MVKSIKNNKLNKVTENGKLIVSQTELFDVDKLSVNDYGVKEVALHTTFEGGIKLCCQRNQNWEQEWFIVTGDNFIFRPLLVQEFLRCVYCFMAEHSEYNWESLAIDSSPIRRSILFAARQIGYSEAYLALEYIKDEQKKISKKREIKKVQQLLLCFMRKKKIKEVL